DYQIVRDAFPDRIVYHSNPGVTFSTSDATCSLLELRREYLATERVGSGGAAIFPIGQNADEARVISRPARWRIARMKLDGLPYPASNEGGVWQLQVRHRAGSLDAAAAGLRHGNLLLSFAMIAMVAGNLAALALVARR